MSASGRGGSVLGWGVALIIAGALLAEFGTQLVYSVFAGSPSAALMAHLVHLLTFVFIPAGGAMLAAGLVIRTVGVRRETDAHALESDSERSY